MPATLRARRFTCAGKWAAYVVQAVHTIEWMRWILRSEPSVQQNISMNLPYIPSEYM